MDSTNFPTAVTVVCAFNILYLSLPGERFRNKVKNAARSSHDAITDFCENGIKKENISQTAAYKAYKFMKAQNGDSYKNYKSIKNWRNINLSDEFNSDSVNSVCRKIWTDILRKNQDNIFCICMSAVACIFIYAATFPSTMSWFNPPFEGKWLFSTQIFVAVGMFFPLVFTVFGHFYVSNTIKSIKSKESDIFETLKNIIANYDDDVEDRIGIMKNIKSPPTAEQH